ncbi:hypothetical protein F5Y04DRAFT_281497 [Hypomontagnella monticulosa]|nr:hypothetical protein F5Y04DRAFT_281497 [Hypomontagnella monticulosa]
MDPSKTDTASPPEEDLSPDVASSPTVASPPQVASPEVTSPESAAHELPYPELAFPEAALLSEDASLTNDAPRSNITTRHLYCRKCKESFPDRFMLTAHLEKYGHITCDSCDKCFHDKQALWNHHIKASFTSQEHRVNQDLACPGCKVTFTSAGRWVQHVESNNCPGVFSSELSSHAPEIMSYLTQAMRPAHQSDIDWTEIPTAGAAHASDVWGPDWEKDMGIKKPEPEPSLVARENPDGFPLTAKQKFYRGSSTQSDLLTGEDAVNLEQQPNNAWGQKKDLFPEKKGQKAIRPPSYLLEEMSRPVPSTRPSAELIIDPDHPNFNYSVFKDPILETYKCPHKGCGSKFKGHRGLIEHLRSLAHSDTRFRCPGCQTIFNSTSAWIQHAETVSRARCRIRTSKLYGHALFLTTNGALDVDELNKLARSELKDTVKLKFDEEWIAKKEATEPSQSKQSKTASFGDPNDVVW